MSEILCLFFSGGQQFPGLDKAVKWERLSASNELQQELSEKLIMENTEKTRQEIRRFHRQILLNAK